MSQDAKRIHAPQEVDASLEEGKLLLLAVGVILSTKSHHGATPEDVFKELNTVREFAYGGDSDASQTH